MLMLELTLIFLLAVVMAEIYIKLFSFFKNLNYVNFEWLRFHVLGNTYPDLEVPSKHGTQIDSSFCMLDGEYFVDSIGVFNPTIRY